MGRIPADRAGRSEAQAAAGLGPGENAVLQAKSRILARLRAETGDLLKWFFRFRGRSAVRVASLYWFA
jgi:hypothetical protein